MKREELKELGLTDEQIDKVMGIHGQDINTLKNDLATAKATIKTKETEIAGIKENNQLRIINMAYVSGDEALRGNEIPLTDVPEWANIQPDITLGNVTGNLYGYFKVPMANTSNIT